MEMVGGVACLQISIYVKMDLCLLNGKEDLLAKENPKRSDYIQALKKADQSDFY